MFFSSLFSVFVVNFIFRIKKAEADAENIKFGFKIKEFDNHVVKMIDNMEKLGELEDFIDSSDEFGFDAEWNQSYSGEMGM